MRLQAAIFAFIFTLGGTLSSQAQKVNIGHKIIDRPSAPNITPGDVYGYVKYSTDLKNTGDVEDFLNILVTEKWGRNVEGNFLVTIALTLPGGTKPIAEKPIMTGSRKEKKFLWITTQKNLSGSVDINGDLLDNVIVRDTNNNLKVSLRAYVTDKITFDIKAYTELLALADAARAAAGLIAIPAVLTGNSDKISKVLETVLSHEGSEEKNLGSVMSFVNLNPGSQANPNKQELGVVAEDDESIAKFKITVTFGTRPSRYGSYDTTSTGTPPNRKGFSATAYPGYFIKRYEFPIGEQNVPITDMIEKLGPKEVVSAFAILRKPAQDYDPVKTPVAALEFCNQVFQLLSKALNERDAAGLYWDILISLRPTLAKTPGAKECVTQKRAMMVSHGLKMSELEAINQ